MRDVALVPQRDVFQGRDHGRADQPRAGPVRFSGSTGLRLCGIADEPFCPGAKYSSASRNFGALQMADLGREPLDRGGDQRQRHEERGVPVARDDLGRDRLRREAELFATYSSTRGSILAKVPTAPEIAQVAISLRAASEALAVARELGLMPGELQPERRRLGVDAVAAPDGRRVFVLEGAPLQRASNRVEVGRAGCRRPVSAAPQGRCRARRSTSCPGARSAPRGRHARRRWSGRRSRRGASRARSRRCARPRRRRFSRTARAALSRDDAELRLRLAGIAPRSRARCGNGSRAPRSPPSPAGCSAGSCRIVETSSFVAQPAQRREHMGRHRGGDFERRPRRVERQA